MTQPQSPRSRFKTSDRSIKKYSAFAVIAVSLCFLPSELQRFPTRLATGPGESGEVTLPDSSVVKLQENSLLKLAFNQNARLLSHGQGITEYDVAHVPGRRFVIRTDLAVITAIGTRFEVDHTPKRTIVTVIDGEVAVEHAPRLWARTDDEIVHAIRDQQVIVERGRRMRLRSYFYQEPLAEVIAAYNRRNSMRLEMPPDAEALTITVTGYFELNNPTFFDDYIKTMLRERKDNKNQRQ